MGEWKETVETEKMRWENKEKGAPLAFDGGEDQVAKKMGGCMIKQNQRMQENGEAKKLLEVELGEETLFDLGRSSHRFETPLHSAAASKTTKRLFTKTFGA